MVDETERGLLELLDGLQRAAEILPTSSPWHWACYEIIENAERSLATRRRLARSTHSTSHLHPVP